MSYKIPAATRTELDRRLDALTLGAGLTAAGGNTSGLVINGYRADGPGARAAIYELLEAVAKEAYDLGAWEHE